MTDFKTITREDLKQKIDSGEKPTLIHTLGESSYNDIHIVGAVMVDAHGDDFVQQVEKLVPDKSAEVIVYCSSFQCGLSPAAAQKLAETGYADVYDYEGGLKDWAEAEYPFEGKDVYVAAAKLKQQS